MPTVTVAGAQGQTVSLSFDSDANAALAQKLAAAITAGVQANTILPAQDEQPSLPSGKTGEFIQTKDGATTLHAGYKAVVNTADEAVIFGSGDADESVLSSVGKFSFIATGGSGTVVGGGGTTSIFVPETDDGDWSINTGNGDDIVRALGGGNDTINTGDGDNLVRAGSGNHTITAGSGDDSVIASGKGNNSINAGGGGNLIHLGGGNDFVTSAGNDTVVTGGGHATIAAVGTHPVLVEGNGGSLFFVAAGGPATILSGTGSDTFLGAKGQAEVHGGSGGHNLLFAGTGNATLFGGGNGDRLFAEGHNAQALHAGVGNETLSGAGATGNDTFYGGAGHSQIIGGVGNDTFVAGTGNATVTAASHADSNLFVFTNGQAGGNDLIKGFASGQHQIDLLGYGNNEITKALKSQDTSHGSTTITLSDNTKITFAGIGQLTANDFVGGSSSSVGGSGHGQNGDEHIPNIRNPLIGHS
jgi:Ca2+-binding RTX toxin-like protein